MNGIKTVLQCLNSRHEDVLRHTLQLLSICVDNSETCLTLAKLGLVKTVVAFLGHVSVSVRAAAADVVSHLAQTTELRYVRLLWVSV